MAANKPKSQYDPNGRYKVLRDVHHPEATHIDGCIRVGREGDPEVVTLKHHADNPLKITLLVDRIKAFEYLGPAEKSK